MITTNLRLIVENILKYGVLTRPQAWVLALVPRSNPLLLLAWVAMAACILTAWAIENIGCNRLKAERKVVLLCADSPQTPDAGGALQQHMRFAICEAHHCRNPPRHALSKVQAGHHGIQMRYHMWPLSRQCRIRDPSKDIPSRSACSPSGPCGPHIHLLYTLT